MLIFENKNYENEIAIKIPKLEDILESGEDIDKFCKKIEPLNVIKTRLQKNIQNFYSNNNMIKSLQLINCKNWLRNEVFLTGGYKTGVLCSVNDSAVLTYAKLISFFNTKFEKRYFATYFSKGSFAFDVNSDLLFSKKVIKQNKNIGFETFGESFFKNEESIFELFKNITSQNLVSNTSHIPYFGVFSLTKTYGKLSNTLFAFVLPDFLIDFKSNLLAQVNIDKLKIKFEAVIKTIEEKLKSNYKHYFLSIHQELDIIEILNNLTNFWSLYNYYKHFPDSFRSSISLVIKEKLKCYSDENLFAKDEFTQDYETYLKQIFDFFIKYIDKINSQVNKNKIYFILKSEFPDLANDVALDADWMIKEFNTDVKGKIIKKEKL